MPTPKLFEKFSSKSSPPDVSPNAEDGASQNPTVASDNHIPGYSDGLKEAWTAAHQELPRAHGAEKFLNKIADFESSVTLSPGQQTVVNTLVVPVKALVNTHQIADNIQKGVNTFMETVPTLMKALDEVAKVHPFISVAVLAFKAVYTLETIRRENDKKVLTLYVEMKDMMEVLVQLKDVNDPKQVAPNGQTIEGRMQKLCEAVAQDIKKCANTCDTYLKKKVVVKFFAGPIWEGRLLEFVGVFTKRREEFVSALSIHTTVGVDVANVKLDTIDERTVELDQKVDIILRLFQEFVSPEQKKLAAMVEKMGGRDAVRDNEEMMEKLAEEPSVRMRAGEATRLGSDNRHGTDRPFNFVELKREIESPPDEAIAKNLESFNDKLDMQKRHIEEAMERIVTREGDRVISAVAAGPHDRIIDRDIYNIWKDMRWRGSVKTGHLVLALRDYCTEKCPDSWAIEYINIRCAQGILEAFDDDASGFVTVNEVNNLTQLRPLDWSLPHWLAYWAIGWQMTCTAYCEKIEEIFDAMIRLASEVLPENRKEVTRYISFVWTRVTVFVQSIEREDGTENLKSKFQSYVDAEEARLRRNFEDIKYNVDIYDTVQLVAGEGRIEMTFFPMLYLALKRDLERISLARKYALSDFEMDDAVDIILWILRAAWDRIDNLKVMFRQQNFVVKDKLEVFAKGLYNIGSMHGADFHGDKLRGLPDPIPSKDETIPDPDSIPLSILKHPLGTRDEVNFSAYDPPEVTHSAAEEGDPLLGVYYGFTYCDGGPMGPMIKFTLNKGEAENAFVAAGTHYDLNMAKEYTITGQRSPPSEDGRIPVELKISYPPMWGDFEWTGVFDFEENSLRGTVLTSTGTTGEFVFKRHPDLVRFYPAPSITGARERWEFATKSVLDRIRRKAWSPAYFFKRIRDRNRYIELSLKCFYGRLSEDDYKEFYALFLILSEADARFCASSIRIKLSEKAVFLGFYCDNCRSTLEGSRIVCMDCHNDETTIDLCSRPECVNSTIKFKEAGRKAHLPSHGMFKVYRLLFDRDTARVEKAAKSALKFVQNTLSELKERGKPMPECVHCKKTISLPCWFCTRCTGKKFICDDCERTQAAFDDDGNGDDKHTRLHTVVRASESVEENELTIEDRLKLVEEELGKMRQLLSKLVEKGTEGPPSDPITKGDLQAAVVEAESAQAVPEENT